MMPLRHKLALYLQLIRFNRPIGTLLLLWPTYWALWLAADGMPSWKSLLIFTAGVVLMRSAGCAINDYADRHFDHQVERTQHRPLTVGAISTAEALGVAAVLALVAFALVLLTNPLTIALSLAAVLLAAVYPFMKRHTSLPQVVLGAAFAWSVPMAFAAETDTVPRAAWLIYTAVVLWTVAYDTFYAMVDRRDDLKAGIRSTAILFGDADRLITGALQAMTILALLLGGLRFELGVYWYLGVSVAAGLFAHQQWLIREREPAACFRAFLNNHWVGAAVFVGLVLDKAVAL
ncbi:MAG TPA: 4-hydroxybenzoate octaprenyltransferase [Pseudomonadales bacterium]